MERGAGCWQLADCGKVNGGTLLLGSDVVLGVVL